MDPPQFIVESHAFCHASAFSPFPPGCNSQSPTSSQEFSSDLVGLVAQHTSTLLLAIRVNMLLRLHRRCQELANGPSGIPRCHSASRSNFTQIPTHVWQATGATGHLLQTKVGFQQCQALSPFGLTALKPGGVMEAFLFATPQFILTCSTFGSLQYSGLLNSTSTSLPRNYNKSSHCSLKREDGH